MRRVVKLSSIVLMGPTASGRVHVLSTLAGPINEARRGDTAPELARLTHALWGLDHYPGYLKRWRDDEIGDLEASLEAALAQVRAQRAERRRDEAGVVRTPALDALRDSERWTVADVLVPKLARALGWDASSSVAAALESQSSGRGLWALLREAGDDAYSLDVLAPAFCEALLEAADSAVMDDGSPLPRLNLDVIGAPWVADLLLAVGERVAAAAFPGETTFDGARRPLDWRHAYVLEYGQGGRDSLVHHTDDSEVTLNVDLGRPFAGGDLLLGPVRGTAAEAASEYERVSKRTAGAATVHLGRQLHAVDKIISGERRVLICWMRSLGGVRSRVCPCCWMNRRDDGRASDCICGPTWNA